LFHRSTDQSGEMRNQATANFDRKIAQPKAEPEDIDRAGRALR
jgi:hypothetical protein